MSILRTMRVIGAMLKDRCFPATQSYIMIPTNLDRHAARSGFTNCADMPTSLCQTHKPCHSAQATAAGAAAVRVCAGW